ncbi:MAG: hypothetical protein M3N31_09280 [Actinomycetota bacterium]|nr:hypothetical protein [Actinomycetota bacterium]
MSSVERAVRLVRERRDAQGVTEGGVTAVSAQLGINRDLCAGGDREEIEEGCVPV